MFNSTFYYIQTIGNPTKTSFNDLKRQARLKKKERQKVHENTLQPPENGLLVDHLIPIAHEVYAARCELISSVSTLVNYTAIYTCRSHHNSSILHCGCSSF